MTDMNTLKRNTAWLSIMSNTLLVVLKLVVGLYVGAVSLVSEALHSGVDLLAAFIAFGLYENQSHRQIRNMIMVMVNLKIYLLQ